MAEEITWEIFMGLIFIFLYSLVLLLLGVDEAYGEKVTPHVQLRLTTTFPFVFGWICLPYPFFGKESGSNADVEKGGGGPKLTS